MYTQPIAARSILNPNYLEYCLSVHYSLGAWLKCTYWLRGLNDTYKVHTTHGTYILRIYRSEITENDVGYELTTLTQLADVLGTSNTQVSVPVRRKNDELYTIIDAPEGPRIAVLFDYISGTENAMQDAESCYAFGQSAAELHAAMDQIVLADQSNRPDLDTHVLLDQSLERIVQYLGDKHEAVSFLSEYAEALKTRIQDAAQQGLDWGLCHGDMHGNNNVFQMGKQFIHYDFEFTAKGWRAYDLAQIKARKRQPAEEARQELWHSFLSGYRSVRSFSALDEQVVDLFIGVRRFWVMGLDVAFIPNDSGALDYGEDWLTSFVDEFRGRMDDFTV